MISPSDYGEADDFILFTRLALVTRDIVLCKNTRFEDYGDEVSGDSDNLK